jgi:hypothetical protein
MRMARRTRMTEKRERMRMTGVRSVMMRMMERRVAGARASGVGGMRMHGS